MAQIQTLPSHSSIITDVPKETPIAQTVFDGMDLKQWVPTYYITNTTVNSHGTTVHYLRSDSQRKLFINVLYRATYNFMSYLGYEPEERFEFVYVNPYKAKNNTIYGYKLLPRLRINTQAIVYSATQRGTSKCVTARFFDNDPDLNYGFAFHAYASTVVLIVRPLMELTDANGKTTSPDVFFRQLLLTIQYPYHMYHYQAERGTLSRLIRGYRDLVNKRGIFEPYYFPI